MKLLVIGGTGKTGRELIKQGLAQGHVITAVVRKPKKIKYNHPNLIVLEGNVLIPERFEHLIDKVFQIRAHCEYLRIEIWFLDELLLDDFHFGDLQSVILLHLL